MVAHPKTREVIEGRGHSAHVPGVPGLSVSIGARSPEDEDELEELTAELETAAALDADEEEEEDPEVAS